MRTFSLEQIGHLLNLSSTFLPTPVLGYSIDSRQVKPGDLFIALQGARVDGHAYLEEAKNRGAIGAIVSKNYQHDLNKWPLFHVEDPLHALQDIAKAYLSRLHVRVVAVTGSVGKTSTKEFIKTLLSTKYKVTASPGNQNSQTGVAQTILNEMSGEENILILEMGMSSIGHLTKLVQIAPPEIAVITEIALVHACNFNSLEEIAWAKAEIFSSPHTRLGVIPKDNPFFDILSKIGHCRKISFSTSSEDADYRINPATNHLIESHIEKHTLAIEKLNLPGKHNVHNLLAAVVVARHFNIDWLTINHTIPLLTLPHNRLQFIHHQGVLFLNDSYNACEVSMKSALEVLSSQKKEGKHIAVLGSMLELGQFSYGCHYRVAQHALNHADEMYCLGEECRPIYDLWTTCGRPAHLFQNRQELVEQLRKNVKPQDVVLLKGSSSKELWKITSEF